MDNQNDTSTKTATASATRLGPGGVAAANAEVDPATAAAMDAGTTAVATRAPMALGGKIVGGGGLSLKPSFMLVAYDVCDWAKGKFMGGSLVLDKEDEIARLDQPVTGVILGMVKYWKHWREKGDQGASPTYPTREAAIAAGETVDWSGPTGARKGPSASEAADLLMLLRRPEGCASTRFMLKLDGAWYAAVRFTADKQLWKDVEGDISRVVFYEAAQRDVPMEEGRLDRYFIQMSTWSKKEANGSSRTHLRLSMAKGPNGGGIIPVPEALFSNLEGIQRMLGAAAEAPASDDASACGGSQPPSILGDEEIDA